MRKHEQEKREMSEGMQIMTTAIVGFLCLAAVVIVLVVTDNVIWGHIATACIEKGGTWARVPILGKTASDWQCALIPPSH
jgi:hypothetical protein